MSKYINKYIVNLLHKTSIILCFIIYLSGIVFLLGWLFKLISGMSTFPILIIIIYIFLIILTFIIMMYANAMKNNLDSKLQQSYVEIEDLYNNAPCGYHSLDQNGVFIHINATELKWLGYQYDEIIGKRNITDFLTPTSREIFYENFSRLKMRGHLDNIEYELIRRDGSIITVLVNSIVIKDNEGNFLISHSNLHDITDRKRTEQALKISEERFHKAMDTAPIGMAIVSLNGYFIQVNQSLCEILGYNKDELESLTFQEITYPDDLAIDLAHAKQLINGHVSSYRIEKRYIRKNGDVIWAQLTASILRDSYTDIPLYFISQIEDITERKLAEEGIRQLAYHDTLTNLPNRRLLLDRLNHDIPLSKRHHHMLAVLFLDLDKFKQVNDRLGHDVGDELLKTVAARLGPIIRTEDTLARLSGDEFVIVLTALTDANDASKIADKILNLMRNSFLIHGFDFNITISIGIAIYPKDGLDANELIKNADTAMYVAKESGRNQYKYYKPP